MTKLTQRNKSFELDAYYAFMTKPEVNRYLTRRTLNRRAHARKDSANWILWLLAGNFPKIGSQTEATHNASNVARIRCGINFVLRLFDRLLRNYFTRLCKFNVTSGNTYLNHRLQF